MSDAIGKQRGGERLEHLHHIDLATPQRRDVVRHRAVRHAREIRGRDAGATQVLLQAHPRRRHLAHRGDAHAQQVAQREAGAWLAAEQQERVARHHLGEADEVAAGVLLIGLHDAHRPAPADIHRAHPSHCAPHRPGAAS